MGKLNQIENPKFQIKDKRGVRDRWNILQGKFKKRMREEEAATGIECEEMSEKDTIIEQLTEQERSFQAKEKSTVKEKEAAESVRKKAIHRPSIPSLTERCLHLTVSGICNASARTGTSSFLTRNSAKHSSSCMFSSLNLG